MNASFGRCVVVGTGLLGASLAGAGRARGLFGRVVGVGRSLANLETAKERGLVDEVTTSLAEGLDGADLVVLATPVVTAAAQLGEVAALAPGATITDVGSVKAPIVAEARRHGLAARFLGAHPLAGKAETGAGAADPDLFAGRRVVLTPDVDTPPALVDGQRALWTAVGADVSVMDADVHDRLLASSSHLPQMVAFALSATVDASSDRDAIASVCAGGFRDTTRLAASDPGMWIDIARLNREAIVDAMDEFSVVWDDLRDAIADEDEDAIRSIAEASRRFRRVLVPS